MMLRGLCLGPLISLNSSCLNFCFISRGGALVALDSDQRGGGNEFFMKVKSVFPSIP